MSNTNLHKAKTVKNDEFYTLYEDIEKELINYDKSNFENKIIYCPCDMPTSNFVKYFENNKDRIGYKKLIHTSIQEGYDFRSIECEKYFEEADIVVTNPPFSLFREFVSCLEKYNLKYAIVGNMNAITYKEIFPLLKDNKLWLGFRSLNKDMYYVVPDYQQEYYLKNKKEGSAYRIIDGKVLGRLASACFFTNIDHDKRHEELLLVKQYNETDYPKYDNYDAIDVSKVTDIPCDYYGLMGVPITFFDKYNSNQFIIVGYLDTPKISNKNIYKRILIRRK